MKEKAPKKNPLYYKVKAAHLELQQAVTNANAMVAAAEAKFEAVMTEAGCEPKTTKYRLDDPTESITPVK